jgi:hypothetical protein
MTALTLTGWPSFVMRASLASVLKPFASCFVLSMDAASHANASMGLHEMF